MNRAQWFAVMLLLASMALSTWVLWRKLDSIDADLGGIAVDIEQFERR